MGWWKLNSFWNFQQNATESNVPDPWLGNSRDHAYSCPRDTSQHIRAPINTFLPTVPTFAVRETTVSRTANVGMVGKNGLRVILKHQGSPPEGPSLTPWDNMEVMLKRFQGGTSFLDGTWSLCKFHTGFSTPYNKQNSFRNSVFGLLWGREAPLLATIQEHTLHSTNGRIKKSKLKSSRGWCIERNI